MDKNCTACKGEEEKEIAMISMSEAAWERNEERHRKEKKNLLVALLIAVLLIVISNIGWLIYESQFDVEEIYVESTADGHANYIGQDGDIYNGESEGAKEN